MIAFDAFVGQVDEFNIIFLPHARDLIGPSEIVSITCSEPFVAAATKGLDGLPKIVDAKSLPE
jgi:hypothetical protein